MSRYILPPSPARTPAARVMLEPLSVLNFHADTDFTVEERTWLKESAKALIYQTSGLLRVSISFDMDFHNERFPDGLDETTPLMIRLDETSPLVEKVDTDKHAHVLAFTNDQLKRVWIIGPRLYGNWDTTKMWERVTMHEILHAAGLDHTPNDGQSLMYPLSNEDHLSTCLNETDAKEFCRVFRGEGCRPETILGCAP